MDTYPKERFEIQPDMHEAVEIIRQAGAWMRDAGLAGYSRWWDPSVVSAEMLSQFAKPDEFFVLRVGARPAATAIFQTEQTLQDWSSVNRGRAPHALYVHYVAVHRDFAGQGLVAHLMEKATELARQQQATVLRLDTNAEEPKLCNLYEQLGFVRVGTAAEDGRVTAFYEKPLPFQA